LNIYTKKTSGAAHAFKTRPGAVEFLREDSVGFDRSIAPKTVSEKFLKDYG
jgi:hypothetical protein